MRCCLLVLVLGLSACGGVDLGAASDLAEAGEILAATPVEPLDAPAGITVRRLSESGVRPGEDPPGLDARSMLLCSSTRVEITVRDAPVSMVISKLCEIAPVPVEIDWQLSREDCDASVRAFEFEGSLGTALQLIARAFGFVSIYEDERVVITRAEYARVQTEVRWYTVDRRLEDAMARWIVPTVQLVDADTVVGDWPFVADADEPILPYDGEAAADVVVTMIRSTVEPDCWDLRDFGVERRGDLVRVCASSRVQRAVAGLLAELAALEDGCEACAR